MFKILIAFFSILMLNNPEDYNKGLLLFKQKKYSEAKPFFLNVIKSNPNNIEVIEFLGDIYGFEKDWDKAMFYYEKLIAHNGNNANYQYKIGGAKGMKAKDVSKFKAISMITDIEAHFLKASKLDKTHIDVRWALVTFYLEVPGILGGSEKKAQKFAQELFLLSKVDGYLSQGFIAEYFKRFKEAEKFYLQAHQIGNSNTTYSKLLYLYKNKLKDNHKAEKLQQSYKNK